MERSPVITFLFHLRIIILSAILMLIDASFVYHAYHYTLQKGASVQIVFGFEVKINFNKFLIIHSKLFFKYIFTVRYFICINDWHIY